MPLDSTHSEAIHVPLASGSAGAQARISHNGAGQYFVTLPEGRSPETLRQAIADDGILKGKGAEVHVDERGRVQVTFKGAPPATDEVLQRIVAAGEQGIDGTKIFKEGSYKALEAAHTNPIRVAETPGSINADLTQDVKGRPGGQTVESIRSLPDGTHEITFKEGVKPSMATGGMKAMGIEGVTPVRGEDGITRLTIAEDRLPLAMQGNHPNATTHAPASVETPKAAVAAGPGTVEVTQSTSGIRVSEGEQVILLQKETAHAINPKTGEGAVQMRLIAAESGEAATMVLSGIPEEKRAAVAASLSEKYPNGDVQFSKGPEGKITISAPEVTTHGEFPSKNMVRQVTDVASNHGVVSEHAASAIRGQTPISSGIDHPSAFQSGETRKPPFEPAHAPTGTTHAPEVRIPAAAAHSGGLLAAAGKVVKAAGKALPVVGVGIAAASAASGAASAREAHQRGELNDGQLAAVLAGEAGSVAGAVLPIIGGEASAEAARAGQAALGVPEQYQTGTLRTAIGDLGSAVGEALSISGPGIATEGSNRRGAALTADKANQAHMESPEAGRAVDMLFSKEALPPHLAAMRAEIQKTAASMGHESPITAMGDDFSQRQIATIKFNKQVSTFIDTVNGTSRTQEPFPQPAQAPQQQQEQPTPAPAVASAAPAEAHPTELGGIVPPATPGQQQASRSADMVRGG